MTRRSHVLEVLLVEDNPGDVRLVKEFLGRAKAVNRVTVASDGVDALSLLQCTRPDGVYRPDLILLDLNLPRKSGHEVLDILKNDSALREIPIVVLTTASADADVSESYRRHANAYIVKPVDLQGFAEVVQAIDTFWLSAARLPHGSVS